MTVIADNGTEDAAYLTKDQLKAALIKSRPDALNSSLVDSPEKSNRVAALKGSKKLI